LPADGDRVGACPLITWLPVVGTGERNGDSKKELEDIGTTMSSTATMLARAGSAGSKPRQQGDGSASVMRGSEFNIVLSDAHRRLPFQPRQSFASRSKYSADSCVERRWRWPSSAGQPANDSTVDALRAAVSHRRQLVLALKPLRQRLHDQLNALAPGLSAPKGHGRALALETSTGRAVLACAVEFAGRPPGTDR
jgi:hypothetical protein